MEDKSQKKIKREQTVFSLNISDRKIQWKDIKDFKFEDDDKLEIAYDEGFYSENNSWDPHFYACIYRMIEETDDEYKKRIEMNLNQEKWAKDRRRESYLKLKKEFENEG